MEELKELVKEYDKLLFDFDYSSDDKKNNRKKAKRLWDIIKKKKDVLKVAISIEKRDNKLSDTVTAIHICYYILNDYANKENEDIYLELVNSVYSNPDIACLYGNMNMSFLLTTLLNDNLVLTGEQKIFLVEQAMRRPGTVLTKDNEENVNYLHYFVNQKEDIRYYILKNNNFTKEEKEKLINLFYADEKELAEIKALLKTEKELQMTKKSRN